MPPRVDPGVRSGVYVRVTVVVSAFVDRTAESYQPNNCSKPGQPAQQLTPSTGSRKSSKRWTS